MTPTNLAEALTAALTELTDALSRAVLILFAVTLVLLVCNLISAIRLARLVGEAEDYCKDLMKHPPIDGGER